MEIDVAESDVACIVAIVPNDAFPRVSWLSLILPGEILLVNERGVGASVE